MKSIHQNATNCLRAVEQIQVSQPTLNSNSSAVALPTRKLSKRFLSSKINKAQKEDGNVETKSRET